jgi:hypothetical protein
MNDNRTNRLHDAINHIRKRIEEDHYTFQPDSDRMLFDRIDEFLASSERSELEKAAYLLLNQFPGDSRHYFVVPSEHVKVPNVYDFSQGEFEYEIDLAIYSGTQGEPTKVAVDIDGLRSHAERHADKDRRKDVNLQAAGWIVMRFGTQDIQRELESFEHDEFYVSEMAQKVENVVEQRARLLTERTYVSCEVRTLLTGYKWGSITCPSCAQWQYDILDRRKHTCRHCGASFNFLDPRMKTGREGMKPGERNRDY